MYWYDRGGGHGDAGSCGTTLGVSLACMTIPNQVCRVLRKERDSLAAVTVSSHLFDQSDALRMNVC